MSRLSSKSPFWVGEANWGQHGIFLDRSALLDRLDGYSADPGVSVAVLGGPRRMGKTSVLRRLAERWEASADKDRIAVIFEDVRKHTSGDPPWLEHPGRLAASVEDQLVVRRVLPPSATPASSFAVLEERLRSHCSAEGARVVRVLVDEVELVYQSDPRLLAEMVHCFRFGGPNIFLLLSWGNWLGSSLSAAVTGALKDAPREQLEPIAEGSLNRDMAAAFYSVGMSLNDDAAELLWEVSQGHPYYAMATARKLLSRREEAASVAEITADDFTPSLLRSAAAEIVGGLQHAWDQVSGTQHRLCWGLASLAVKTGTDNGRFDVSAARQGFTELQVADYLRERGQPTVDVTRLRSAVPGLVANRVVEPAGEERGLTQWRIRSPFFAAWLASYAFDDLDPDTRRVEEGSGKTAADLLVEARSSSERGDDDVAARLLRRARLLAPLHPEILVEAARVARRRGELGEAASLLRDARVRGDVCAVQEELAEVVERQILAALAHDDDPLVLWTEYRELARLALRPLDPVAVRGVIDAYAARWKEQVEDERYRDALGTVRQIERDSAGPLTLLPGWRRSFLGHYAAFMRTHPRSARQLRCCLGAIACGLLPLTEETVERSHPAGMAPSTPVSELPQAIRALLSHYAPAARVLGDLDESLREVLTADIVRRADVDVPEEWRVTLEVVEAADKTARLGLPPILDDESFRRLLLRAPPSSVARLRAAICSRLPAFVASDVRLAATRAERLLAVLGEAGREDPDISVSPVVDAVFEVALSLDDAASDSVERVFSALPRVLGQLHSWPGAGSTPLGPTAALEIAELVVSAARRGSDKEGWRIVARQSSAAQEWRELVEGLSAAAADNPERAELVSRLLVDLTLPEDLAPLVGLTQPTDIQESGAAVLAAAKRLLDPRLYRVEELLDDQSSFGPHHLVWRFRGAWRRSEREDYRETHIKLYRLPGDDSTTRQFLESLWAHERRVLFEIGSRRKGRSLAELRGSELRPEDGYLLLVTEPVGRVTLRDLLDNGRASRWRLMHRATLWRELLGLMRGLQALHDAHYMHRNLRPETIRVRIDGDADGGAFRFKLVDFEWSIYLHSVLGDDHDARVHRDYYSAPEVLLSELEVSGEGDSARGESFASDLYALGLVLFELLVRPLTRLELGEFRDRRSYSVQSHREFLLRLRDEVRDVGSGLSQEVQLLLLGLLRFEPASRTTTLRTAVAQARRFALGAEELQASLDEAPLPAVATLHPGTPDAIANYIARYPGVGRQLDTVEETQRFIERQLRGARVFENVTDAARPLFIEGRTVNFTAKAFEPFNDGQSYDTLSYLWVARRLDAPGDEPLIRLGAGVTIEDLLPEAERGTHLKLADQRWSTLFSLVGDLDAPDAASEVLEQNLLHQALTLMAEAEEELLEEQIVAYQIVKGPTRSPNGRFDTLVIGPRASSDAEARDADGAWRTTLRRSVAQQAQLAGPDFELAPRRSVSDWVQDDMIWQAQDVDAEDTHVTLARRAFAPDGGSKPPENGWIRSAGIVGSQALLSRRRSLLRRLKGDRHVLHALSRPAAAYEELPGSEPNFFLELDEDKQRIVRRMQTARPMLLVQGPPGTGKTTLAAEVVLQALESSSAARILVTAQGHDPLNHLLATVAEQLEAHRPTRKRAGRIGEKLLVRLVPERRLSTTEGTGGPARDVESQFNPGRVTEELLKRTLAWKPDKDVPVHPDLLAAWSAFVEEQRGWSISEEFQRRIVNSANIVCATANDRALEYAFRFERPFDLLIYEEAGRALPLELLAPMTNAPRWLLIGDPEQLPPHQAPDLERILGARLRDDAVKDEVLRTDRLSRRRQRAIGIIEMFRHLWRTDESRVFSDRLTLQYRMHPAICDAVSDTYYDGDLKCADRDALRKSRTHRVVRPSEADGRAVLWIDVPWVGHDGIDPCFGEEPASGGGYTNHAEVHAVQRFFAAPQFKMRGHGGFRPGEVVFLSPYRAQVERFRRVFATWSNPDTGSLRDIAHTVDSFQGRQADVVVVSLVRNNSNRTVRGGLGFLSNPARSVVMFSRAQSLLVVVGCSRHFLAFEPSKSPIRRFFEHVRGLEAEGEALVVSAGQFFDDSGYRSMAQHWRNRERARHERMGRGGGAS